MEQCFRVVPNVWCPLFMLSFESRAIIKLDARGTNTQVLLTNNKYSNHCEICLES